MDKTQIMQDLQSAGFETLPENPHSQHMLHINKRGVEGIKIRIDTPHNGVPYNHMHIQYERTGLYYDKNLNPVDRKSPNAHIRIR